MLNTITIVDTTMALSHPFHKNCPAIVKIIVVCPNNVSTTKLPTLPFHHLPAYLRAQRTKLSADRSSYSLCKVSPHYANLACLIFGGSKIVS